MNKSELATPSHEIEFEFGEFRLVPAERRLYRAAGGAVELSSRQFDALLFLVERRGELLDKETLLAALWPGLVVEENNLNQLVMTLRRALGDEAQASRWIQTVPRRGFRFVGAVRSRPLLTGDPADVHSDPAALTEPPSAPPVAAAPNRLLRTTLVVVLVAMAGATAVLLWSSRLRTPPAPALTTLAVLPFKPLVPDSRDAVLEVGMADSLIAQLSSISGLVVRSIGSVRRFGEPDQDSLLAARQLEVEWVLDGTVQRWGDRVRVTARLLKAADGTAAWSGSFDDRFEDVFAVQAGISQRVVQQLLPQLSRGEQARLASMPARRDLAAYELYLTARYHAQGLRPDGLARSVELYQRAVELDPGYALAYAGLTDTYRRMVIGIDAPPAKTLALGLKAAQRAVEIAPGLAEAHTALGWMRWWAEWDWPAAEQSFRRAIALNPNLAEAHFGLGHLMCSQQRCDEGFAFVRRARELDPLSLIVNVIEASYLRSRGAVQESRVRLDRALQIESRFWPAHQALAGLQISAGQNDEAVATLRQAQSLTEGSVQPTANLAVLLAGLGRSGEARELLAGLLVLSQQRYVPPMMFAAVHCALGETGNALAWIERARDARDVNLTVLSPCSVQLRDEPRFDALRRAMKLPAWREGFCAPLQAPTVACPG